MCIRDSHGTGVGGKIRAFGAIDLVDDFKMCIRDRNSLNTIAVKLIERIGVQAGVDFAKNLGITSLVETGPVLDAGPSLALGGLTKGVSPLQMTGAKMCIRDSLSLWIQLRIYRYDSVWVAPFGYLRIIARLRLPEAFRSLPRPSSALGA